MTKQLTYFIGFILLFALWAIKPSQDGLFGCSMVMSFLSLGEFFSNQPKSKR